MPRPMDKWVLPLCKFSINVQQSEYFYLCVTMNITDPNRLPYWLWEGTALYEAGQNQEIKKIKYLEKGDYLSLHELNDFQKAFELGYSLVE
jgi:hypothetical protein